MKNRVYSIAGIFAVVMALVAVIAFVTGMSLAAFVTGVLQWIG